jgi:hypothetical protein
MSMIFWPVRRPETCASWPVHLLLLLFTLTPPYLSSPSSYSSSFAKGCSTRTRDIRLLLALKNVTLFPPLSPFVPSSLPPSPPPSVASIGHCPFSSISLPRPFPCFNVVSSRFILSLSPSLTRSPPAHVRAQEGTAQTRTARVLTCAGMITGADRSQDGDDRG